jgi:hypothetical protein
MVRADFLAGGHFSCHLPVMRGGRYLILSTFYRASFSVQWSKHTIEYCYNTMTVADLRTAIEGMSWVIDKTLNRAKVAETIFELQDLRLLILKHRRYHRLLPTVNYALRLPQAGPAMCGARCCRRCRYTQWGDCRCWLSGAYKNN